MHDCVEGSDKTNETCFRSVASHIEFPSKRMRMTPRTYRWKIPDICEEICCHVDATSSCTLWRARCHIAPRFTGGTTRWLGAPPDHTEIPLLDTTKYSLETGNSHHQRPPRTLFCWNNGWTNMHIISQSDTQRALSWNTAPTLEQSLRSLIARDNTSFDLKMHPNQEFVFRTSCCGDSNAFTSLVRWSQRRSTWFAQFTLGYPVEQSHFRITCGALFEKFLISSFRTTSV